MLLLWWCLLGPGGVKYPFGLSLVTFKMLAEKKKRVRQIKCHSFLKKLSNRRKVWYCRLQRCTHGDTLRCTLFNIGIFRFPFSFQRKLKVLMILLPVSLQTNLKKIKTNFVIRTGKVTLGWRCVRRWWWLIMSGNPDPTKMTHFLNERVDKRARTTLKVQWKQKTNATNTTKENKVIIWFCCQQHLNYYRYCAQDTHTHTQIFPEISLSELT